MHVPREAALAEAGNRNEVYPRWAQRRKPTELHADDSDGNAHRAESLAGEGENDGSKAKMSVRVARPWWACGWGSSERGTENAPCALKVEGQSEGAGEYP